MENSLDLRDGRKVHEDLAAERAVLGAVLADNTLIAAVGEVVHADDFSSPAHAQIFAAMIRLDGKQQQVDHLTLAEELKVLGHLVAVGGPAYLMRLDQVVPLASNAVQYANIVKDQALRRRLANVGREIQDLASQETGELEVLLDEAERKVFLLAEKKREGDLRPVSELMEHTLDLLDKMKAASTGITGLSTGYIDLDNQLTGLHAGELIILAARPGVGKTSFAMNIAVNAALKENKAVGIFSLEMPADQLLMRLLASTARVDMKKLRGGRLSPHDEEKFQEMAGALYNAPIYIDDSGGLSPFDLRAKARRVKQKDPRLSLLIIDYLQLMHQKGKVESRQLEVAEISRALKQLAKELEVPIIALSQLSRKVEERKGGKPMLSDLRESGSIEQDADVVMFIHREETEEGGEAPPQSQSNTVIPVELIIAKQRNGPIGEISLVFLAEYTRFESRSRAE
ncbi:replicative DNA helicase [Myxococcus sp. CA051A]|uniref:Replicative DNA helicase n=1 Tax=Myxococcus llanfairpwllgwyngyllgogerychwyrndrobwllllantysiliogogogochensis TaxID=2590453 RepID=A0A540WLE8_9BACT|nr:MULTISPECIES: replicative DNA helicase [Myxococcus]NTX01217.1 replicative DNA helicase [Myxococcus sp. CA040A]NTX12077.1 replicative DNA helicase [Myxococcus sp. CA056]NTX33092.1 replicative DNA helicase [Myxococcus sp. CA033]NTX56086.1 replicative DNA helicase [Myxococcus sp. CA039A]NTX59844.1 replicative DNA helicase [Myxococcus sp. CA051A]